MTLQQARFHTQIINKEYLKHRKINNMKDKGLILLITLGLIGAACSGNEAEQETVSEEVVRSVNVIHKTIVPATFASYVRVVGSVETSNDIMISAEVSGRVVSHSVKEGEAVRKGQTIMIIDDAKLKQEEARLVAMTSQAKENYERLKKVYEEDGIGSELDYLNAKYAYEQSNSVLESLRVDLANTRIKAPFNGIVENRMAEVGEMVGAGTPVVRLIGADEFMISAGVPARYSNAVKTGDIAEIWFDDQVSDTLRGEITFAASSINTQNRTFTIEVELPDAASQYKVDMIANLRLKTNELDDVIVISEEYIYSKDGQYVVYVLSENEEGKPIAEERAIDLGLSYKTNVIIESGLSAGDELITLGSAFLDDGMRITPKQRHGNNLAAN